MITISFLFALYLFYDGTSEKILRRDDRKDKHSMKDSSDGAGGDGMCLPQYIGALAGILFCPVT